MEKNTLNESSFTTTILPERDNCDSNNNLVDNSYLNTNHITTVTNLILTNLLLSRIIDNYEKILDEIEDSLMETDLNGNVTYVNRKAAELLGVPKEKAIGLNYRYWTDEVNKKIVFENYHRAYLTGAPCRFIYEAKSLKGNKLIIEDVGSPRRDEKGIIVGFRSTARDITARVNIENEMIKQKIRLETIFSSVNEGIITVDPSFTIMDVNKAAENICGISITNERGKNINECLSMCSKSCIEVINETLYNKLPIKDYLIECNHKYKKYQLVSITCAPLKDEMKNFLGAALVIRDVTKIKVIERELKQRNRYHNIVGKSREMQYIYNIIEDLANYDTTVLITGESGTGKELVAKALHYSSYRAFKPFIAVNCAALSENLLESELFGHIKGAFTGAIKEKTGRFELADGGTLLLDEIGDISPSIQLKLLRFLQEKTFEKVGDSEPKKVDVRIIACTNKNLKEKVKKGEFREDLYYRLKVVEIALPPLRSRMEDIPLLVDYFCRIFNERYRKKIEGISQEVLRIFMNHSWPGNVRELEHVMEHAFILSHGHVITINDLPVELREISQDSQQKMAERKLRKDVDVKEIIEMLKSAKWNKTKAACLLGISRWALYRRLKRFNINVEEL
ncbi:MAG: sigma 54-interacting transcriptional regulator [Syntrophales bacterium]|nr:sigma 54-interacting transcriptional regulator [Syntrophales bacterium]